MRLVLKVGGSVLQEGTAVWLEETEKLRQAGHQVAIVHGGGAFISERLQALGEPVEFIDGQRVTTEVGLEEVVRVLAGTVNTDLVRILCRRGIPAVGLTGADGTLLTAVPHAPELGRVGRITHVHSALIRLLWAGGFVPVIAPVVTSQDGQLLNANGDWAAALIAGALKTDALVFYTDSGGVRREPSDPSTITEQLSREEVAQWLASGRAVAGMVPKLEAALAALDQGVEFVRIGTFFEGRVAGTKLYA